MSCKKCTKLIRLKYQNNPKDLGDESKASLGHTIDVSPAIKDDIAPEQMVDHYFFR